ncbi:kelch-like protein 20 [Paramacrobiotus metropolitanus]|uniref:kelch-like protein 20 n=1 Tax=Paramacrobiotus metropolitanus TaxID=2943436 RepID=UPI0024462C34|nr:kelch-like protein 20 [Paramacrobiotus metropolitanus]
MDSVTSKMSFSRSLSPVLDVLNSSDVLLRGADGQSKPNEWIPCHRAILAARSTYFRSMFASQMKESHEEQIQLKDIPHEILERIVQYMYTTQISLDANNVLLLLESALFLDVTEIVSACTEFLHRNISIENWLPVQHTAEFLSCSDLIKICDEFLVKNFSAVLNCDDFLEISESKMRELIALDDLYVKSEDEVADAVIRWLNKDPARMRSIGEILPLVRAPFLSAEKFQLVRNICMNPERACVEDFRKVTDGIIHRTPYQHRESYKPILVAVGGDHRLKCVYRFDPTTKKWIPVRLLPQSPKNTCGDLPIVVTSSGRTRIHDLIYDEAIARSCVWRYDSDTDQWERLTPLPVGRCEGPLVGNEKVYVLVSGDPSQCFMCYNETSKEWETVAAVPGKVLLSSALTVDYNGCIFKFGGHDVSYKVDKKGRLSGAAYCFNPRDKTVKVLRKMPTKRYKCSVGVGPDGLIYVAGGISRNRKHKSDEFLVDYFEVYDPKTNQWQRKHAEKWGVTSDSARLFTLNGNSICCRLPPIQWFTMMQLRTNGLKLEA